MSGVEWHRVSRTSETLPLGKNCQMAGDVTHATTQVVPADARATSKEVDLNEATIRFAQEIYDRDGRLVAKHEKFPVDLGHQYL